MARFLYFLVIFLVLISEGLKLSGGEGGNGVRPPENTCHKVIGSGKCDRMRCTQECSKDAGGTVAECKDNGCVCTYYCKQPPAN
ncbi:hypothetical protein ACLOJK_025460 [Asimina triloba]